jgi:hypothetical protein
MTYSRPIDEMLTAGRNRIALKKPYEVRPLIFVKCFLHRLTRSADSSIFIQSVKAFSAGTQNNLNLIGTRHV